MQDKKEKDMGIMISRAILSIMLIFGVYAFFDKDPIAAKLLAAGGSIGLVSLLRVSFLKKDARNTKKSPGTFE